MGWRTTTTEVHWLRLGLIELSVKQIILSNGERSPWWVMLESGGRLVNAAGAEYKHELPAELTPNDAENAALRWARPLVHKAGIEQAAASLAIDELVKLTGEGT